jgi:hypothetical protein
MGLALRIRCADPLDVEVKLLGPAVLRRPVRCGAVAAQELVDSDPGLVDAIGPVRGAVPPRAGEPLHVRHVADRGDDQVGLQPGAVGWLHPGGAVSAEQLMPRGPTR